VANADLTRADPPDAPALGDSRARVLEALQTAGTALGVGEVAAKVGLHPNTTRFHLDGLVRQGLAERNSEDRATPGRPRALYSASRGRAPAGRRSYRLLAQILTSYLASASRQPEKAALRAGEEWGRYLAERPAPFRRTDAAAATRQLVQTLDDIGFAPESTTVRRKRQIQLHHCPFREAAEQHGEVVCTIHLGLMRGLLAELDAPFDAESLESFVEPDLCIAHLAARRRKDDELKRGMS
jgi:predicted ArsR family transcriptional regulator